MGRRLAPSQARRQNRLGVGLIGVCPKILIIYRIDDDAIVIAEVFAKKTGRTPAEHHSDMQETTSRV